MQVIAIDLCISLLSICFCMLQCHTVFILITARMYSYQRTACMAAYSYQRTQMMVLNHQLLIEVLENDKVLVI